MKKTIDLDFSDMLKTCLRFARVRVRIISEIIERWTGNMKGLLKFSGILPPPSCSDSGFQGVNLGIAAGIARVLDLALQ